MAANDRETTFTIRAADLSSQQINQVVASVERLLAVQQKQNAAAEQGAVKTSEFNKSLKDLTTGADAVARQITSLQRYAAVAEEVAKRQQKLTDLQAQRQAVSELENPTKADERKADKLDTQIKAAQRLYDNQIETMAKAEAQMQRMGSSTATLGTDLDRLRAFADQLQATLTASATAGIHLTEAQMQAAAAAKEQAAAEETAAKALKEVEAAEKAAQSAFNARRREEKQAEQERVTAAEKAMTIANAVKRPDRGGDMMAAMRAQDEALKREADAEKAAQAAFDARRRAEKQAEQERAAAAAKATTAANAVKREDRGDVMLSLLREQETAAALAVKTAKEAEDAQKSLTRQREADMDAMKRAYDFEQKLLRASLAAADERLAKEKALAEQRMQIAAQRDLTAGGLSAAQRVSPPGVAAEPVPDFSKVSAGISGLIDPATAARRTLEGLIAEVDQLSNSLSGGGRRRSEDIQNDIRNIGIAAAELKRQGSLIDAFQEQEAATLKAQKAMQVVQAEMERLAVKGQTLTAVDKAYANEVKSVEAELKRLISAYEQENAELVRQQTLLQRTGIDYKNLDETVSRLRASASGVGQALASVQEKVNSKGGKTGEVFLGLRPYELQNLSYQINDVFTQLASGTSLTQTLSQQGGQIFQLFERQIVGVLGNLRAIPFAFAGIGVAAAAVTVGVLAFVRAIEVAGERRHLMAALAQNVDGTRYSVEKLLDSAKDMQRFGVNLDEAANGARALIAAGAEPERIKPLMQLAAAFANANALKFPDAMKQVVAAFTGSGKQLLEFATQTNNLFTTNQFNRIRQLVESGDIVQARFEAFALIFPRMQEAADKNTSAITKSWRTLRAEWDRLLDSIGNNVLVNAFGTVLLDAMRSAAESATALFKVLNAIFTLDVKDMPLGRTLAQLAGFGALYSKIIGEQGPSATAGEPSAPGQKPGETAEFVTLRDRVADAVGISRDALRVLQQSEGVWDARLGKWSDALDKAGNVLPDGGKSAMQVVQSTFDEMKRRYPELIKGDVHDLQSNLMAGALYFREMAEKAGNNFGQAVAAYKQGPGAVFGTPEQRDQAMRNIPGNRALENRAGVAQAMNQFSGPVITRQTPPQTLESVPQAPAAPSTQAQGNATANFEKARQEQEDSQRKAFATEAEAYDIFQRDLARAKDKVTAEAQAQAEKDHALTVDQATLNKRVEAEQDTVRKEYHERWLQRLREREAFAATIRERELAADKSNLASREKLINDQFDKELLNARELASKGNYGIPLDKIDDDINKARQQALDRAAVDVSKVIIEDAVKQRDATLGIIRQKINMPGANIPDLLSQANKTALDALPALNKKLDDAERALDKVAKLPGGGGETEEVKTARADIALKREQAKHPEVIGQLTQQGASTVQEGITGAVQQNKAQLDIITDSVKVAGVSATDAIGRIVEFGKKSVPALHDLVKTTNAGLQAIADNSLTDPARRDKILTEIRQNELAPSKAAVDLQTAIVAALAEQRAQLDKLIAEYKQAVTDLANKIRAGLISPLAAAAERAKLDANYIPRIAQQGKDYQSAIGTARGAGTQLGLGPAFQAGLAEEGARAKTESDSGTLSSKSVQDSAKLNLDRAREAVASATEMQTTQQKLLAAHATTIDEANAATKQSFEDAKAQVDALAPAIQADIDRLKELGDSNGAAKLAADFKLLQTQVKYVDPELKKIADTLDSAVVSEATKAFDTIAESIGKVIAGTASWKDVLSSVGTAFASFAAGILKKVAEMIIQMYVLKAVQSLTGMSIGGGASAITSTTDAFSSAGMEVAAAAILHSGGAAGSDGAVRQVDMSVFNFARRMHDGGAVGLAADEVPAILQRGERVLSKAQMGQQNAAAAASGSKGGTAIRNVLAVGDKEIAAAMNSSHGEDVVLNILRRNAPTVKKYVG